MIQETLFKVYFFFFLDEKETKNQDLGFSAIKIGSLPKTQKLARSQTHGLKQFEFLNGPETSGSPFCPDASGRLPNPMVAAEFLSAEIVNSIPLNFGIWSRSIGIQKLEFFVIRAFVVKS
jgi:hypothetical protein